MVALSQQIPQITYFVNFSIATSIQQQPIVICTPSPAFHQERASYSENKISTTTIQSKANNNKEKESAKKETKFIDYLLEADLDNEVQKKVSISKQKDQGDKNPKNDEYKAQEREPKTLCTKSIYNNRRHNKKLKYEHNNGIDIGKEEQLTSVGHQKSEEKDQDTEIYSLVPII
ncbi:hypothetical protein F8M41_019799 [Gigaspora margarita]|uniref:Uncharacterized protein n=1 Tax=Gigaspora margarita TaxID=4874 RepID=A0A8H4AJK9_GIGMA|nr:hypothetical protein F8M41_019799 [Gigaspora margarita]